MDSLSRHRCTSLRERTTSPTVKNSSFTALGLPGKSHQSLKITRSHTLQDDGNTPDVATMKLPGKVVDRLKRDYNISDAEVTALRFIMSKVDLYDNEIRDRWHEVLKSDRDGVKDGESLIGKVLKDDAIESLKQKLFLSRKELDTYISFTKKMEREKRQSQSEKEELETKIQWHERRMKRFEEENKQLKVERSDLCKQVNELKGKTSKEAAKKNSEQVANVDKPEIESSKQRLIYEADAFAQERSKLIKDRQKLDEEVRTVQLRCVSLIAQLKHSEGIVQELKDEKEKLKERLDGMSQTSVVVNKNTSGTEEQFKALEEKYDKLQNEYRSVEESRIDLYHENMALKDTVNVVQKANEDANQRVKDIDVRYRETLSELRSITLTSEGVEEDKQNIRKELDKASETMSEMQDEIDSSQELLKKLLDRLVMELREHLSEDDITKAEEAGNLQERVESLTDRVVAHISEAKKVYQKYEEVQSENSDLEEQAKYLKAVLQGRMDVKNLKVAAVSNQTCDCSKATAKLKEELEECQDDLQNAEEEVNRLHQDKQQLLMSFLNLQASKSNSLPSNNSSGPSSKIKDDDIEDASVEIRKYLGIIEQLTEEKLHLENVVSDMDAEQEKLYEEINNLKGGK